MPLGVPVDPPSKPSGKRETDALKAVAPRQYLL